MFIDIVPNRNSPPAVLLREGGREGGKKPQAHAGKSHRLAGSQNSDAEKIITQ
jgi:hypothetical protein